MSKEHENRNFEREVEKVRKILEKKIIKQDRALKSASKEQFNKLVGSFEKLEKEFKREEDLWLIVTSFVFLCLGFFVSVPIFDIFMYQYTYKIIFWGFLSILGLIAGIFLGITDGNKDTEIKEEISIKKKLGILWNFIKKYGFILGYFIVIYFSLVSFLRGIDSPTESVFQVDSKYLMIPFGALLSTLLYFSIYQFSKSKKLRIENQNKVALLHGMFGLKADTDENLDKSFFYNNIADVVFSKVYQDKNDQDLPIDKVLDIVKIISSKK